MAFVWVFSQYYHCAVKFEKNFMSFMVSSTLLTSKWLFLCLLEGSRDRYAKYEFPLRFTVYFVCSGLSEDKTLLKTQNTVICLGCMASYISFWHYYRSLMHPNST